MDLNTITALVPATEATWQDGDAFLAGGSWLFSEPQPALRRLLDLQAYGWPALEEASGGLEIAATCTFAELAAWAATASWPAAELVRQCCEALLGSFKVWNTATVGGNICLSLPAGPMTSLTAALDGVCEIWSPDGSVNFVPVADFVTGPSANVLRPGQLLRKVTVSGQALTDRTAFRQISLSKYGRSAAVVIGRVSPDGATVITITAATVRPVQLRFAEPPTVPQAHVALIEAGAPYHSDVHGAPRWRAAMTERFVAEVAEELASTP